ncbi:MAG: FkbM family methyltransferase [Ignavibacteriae bacterium]|nr:FkbM family methyltransferase [Ignavibacteria bacterium]MBI3364616.1 FkbM family methyltransferase [Ignavibacteriota bacterium]
MLARKDNLVGHLTFYYDSGDTFVGDPVARSLYEPFEGCLFLDSLSDNDIVIDVGANIGYYTLLASIRVESGKIFAFEPNLKSYLLLEKNVRENNLAQVETLNMAVGPDAGTMRLYLSPENNGDHRLYASAGWPSEIVQVIALDPFISERQLRPAVIKIDTQGFDYLVLKSMESFLRTASPLTLFTEFWHYGNTQAHVPPEAYYNLLRTYFPQVEFIDETQQKSYPVDLDFIMTECGKQNGMMHANLLCRR